MNSRGSSGGVSGLGSSQRLDIGRSRRRAGAPRSPPGAAKFHMHGMPSKCSAKRLGGGPRRSPRASARRRCPRRRTARCRRPPGRSAAWMRRKRLSWSGTQWKVAVEKTTSTGSAQLRARRGPVTSVLGACRRALSRALSIIDWRAVERDHPPLGQALEQQLGHAARARAGVEHGLVARPAPGGRGPRMPHSNWGSETRS